MKINEAKECFIRGFTEAGFTNDGKPYAREQLEYLFDKSMQAGCLLCGQNALTFAVYQPKHPEKIGAKNGKKRFAFYSLCEEHSPRAENFSEEEAVEVEKKLEQMYQRQQESLN